MAKESLTKQTQKIVSKEYNKAPTDSAVEDTAEDDVDD